MFTDSHMENSLQKKKIANAIIHYFKLIILSMILTLIGILISYVLEDTDYDTGWGYFLDDIPIFIFIVFIGVVFVDTTIKICKMDFKTQITNQYEKN